MTRHDEQPAVAVNDAEGIVNCDPLPVPGSAQAPMPGTRIRGALAAPSRLPMGEGGYFQENSMLRRVIGEFAVALSGPRALLMMAAHPVAFAGFFAHTGALADPYVRLRRTGEVLDLIAWSEDRRTADRATARVRAMHRRVRGQTTERVGRFPAGTPYRADDPELLLWILACLADSAALVYEKYVRDMSASERDALWADYRLVGGLFGLREHEMPRDWNGFRAYVDAMLRSGDLTVSDTARELALGVVLHPPAPLPARPLVELINQITIGLLPAALRRQYRLRWDPVRGLALAGGAHYAKRLLLPLAPDRLRLIPQARAATVARLRVSSSDRADSNAIARRSHA